MALRFNTPPGWPPAPQGWLPPAGWQPDPTWPPPPVGWQLYVDDAVAQGPANLPAMRAPAGAVVAQSPAELLEPQPMTPVPATTVPMTPVPVSTVPVSPPPQAPGPLEPGVLWAAVGQPLTGIGGGRYKLTETMLYFERGFLSINAQQVPIGDVIDVDLRQSITQKARGVGSVVVKVQRSNGVELVVLEDIPQPREAVAVINDTAHAARLAQQQRTNTRHYSGLPGTPAPAAPAPTAAPAPVDPIAQLRQLGELRDAGILTEEEFAAKKAEILSRL
ncbi:PH domain-containing protein [Micromonospora purpureochromogenes]|uniref:PH domain-containing protein n=1 Tax=Micromonospora purpureochromogenes TaxID=47872 RepID=A0A1C4XXP8_9ACTN|nr:SHOCT domain-containing protein [Micromonospora purpureochromogenes]SCF13240.1 PH domain-containing protein [Micromonospora purpureochromogenes]